MVIAVAGLCIRRLLTKIVGDSQSPCILVKGCYSSENK